MRTVAIFALFIVGTTAASAQLFDTNRRSNSGGLYGTGSNPNSH
jgi:hypothetical protein